MIRYSLSTQITYSVANMLKLGEKIPLIVCFCHKLHTSISVGFKNTYLQPENKELQQLDSTIINIVKYVNKASNLKNKFSPRLQKGGPTRAWGSKYDMYSSVLINTSVIRTTLQDKQKYDLLVHFNNTLLDEVVKIL